jgi:predicted O-methyltransferase YrrM
MNNSPPVKPWDRYRGIKKWGWYLDDLDGWMGLLHSSQQVKALEVGAFDGVSANLMLDLLFTHPGSELHVIDPFLPDPTTPELDTQTRHSFEENCRIGGHEKQIALYEGLSGEVLAWMIAKDGFWESFDFIYVDGSHLAKDVFIDAALSWNLLRPGGVIAFDDYAWGDWMNDVPGTPRAAIEAFDRVFADQIELLRVNWRALYRKKAGPAIFSPVSP